MKGLVEITINQFKALIESDDKIKKKTFYDDLCKIIECDRENYDLLHKLCIGASKKVLSYLENKSKISKFYFDLVTSLNNMILLFRDLCRSNHISELEDMIAESYEGIKVGDGLIKTLSDRESDLSLSISELKEELKKKENKHKDVLKMVGAILGLDEEKSSEKDIERVLMKEFLKYKKLKRENKGYVSEFRRLLEFTDIESYQKSRHK